MARFQKIVALRFLLALLAETACVQGAEKGQLPRVELGNNSTVKRQEPATVGAEAKSLASEGKIEQALVSVEQFRKLVGETAVYYELKATVLTLGKDYESAEKAFSKMLELAPNSHVARFNWAETIMLQGQYAKAEREFEHVEKDRRPVDLAIADLARFKRVACFLGQGNVIAAAGLLPPVQEGRESPALYYSRAMVAWVRKDADEANRLLAEARNQFSREVDDLYTDTFVELRWGTRGVDGQFNFGLKFR